MKNAKISEVLKNYRKLNKLSVRDVSGILKEKSLNVAEKTIYGWESGQTQPNADTLLMLCEIYNIENIGCDPFGSDPCGCGIDFLRVPQQGDVSAGPARAGEISASEKRVILQRGRNVPPGDGR